MKKRVLLVDESLTVQKVVALTLDKNRYNVYYAKARSEAMKLVVDSPPDLILVSDQVPDINIGSFPREVETWLARRATVPPIVLVTAQDLREMRHYAGVLKKPFSPQTLQAMVMQHASVPASAQGMPNVPQNPAQYSAANPPNNPDEFEDQRLQKIFNEAFNDEAKLVRETFTESHPEASSWPSGHPEASSWPSGQHDGLDWSADAAGSPPAGGLAPAPHGEREASRPLDDALWMDRPAREEMKPQAGSVKRPATQPSFPGAAKAAPQAGYQAVPQVPPMPYATPGELGASRSPHVPHHEPPQSERETSRSLWGAGVAKSGAEPELLGASDSMAYKATLESHVRDKLESENLEEVVERVLGKILPPIVERLVGERLDRLLKEQESFMELKP